jgi:chaperone modulatory protein CbpM
MIVKETIKIAEAAEKCGIEIQVITHWIEKEWIIPAEPNDKSLDREDLARINLIKNLTEELGVNEEGIPIILHILDQLYNLHYGVLNSDQRK